MRYDHQARRRRSIRLPHWDYSQTGAYFVTICTRDRDCLFGDERFRAIAEDVWASVVGLSDQPGEFIVMPHHVHGIIWITPATPTTPRAEQLPESHLVTELRYPRIAISGDPVAQPLRRGLRDGLDPGSLPVIVRTFKSAAAKRINSRRGTRGCVVWQDDYYEHIIRDEEDLHRIQQCILDNPAKWAEDPDNPANFRRATAVGAEQLSVPSRTRRS